MPLAYALVMLVGILLLLTWGALKIQVALAGFLNGESVWSKAQKQAVIALDSYAGSGSQAAYADFRHNYALLGYDRYVRDALTAGRAPADKVMRALSHGNAMPEAVPGVVFMLRYLQQGPYMRQALTAWRHTDHAIAELGAIADQMHEDYAGGNVTPEEISSQRSRIHRLNDQIAPYASDFSEQIARGAGWIGHVLFGTVLVAACLASLFWLAMARRILNGIRGTEERYRLLFDHAADAIVMVDDSDGSVLDVNRTASLWTGRSEHVLIGGNFADLFVGGRTPWSDSRPVSQLLRREGTPRFVEAQSSLVTWGDRPVRQAILRDVSDRVSMEQERRIAAEALASIAEGVIIADAQYRVLSVNRAHEELTGFSAQSLRGQRFDRARHMPDGSPLPESMWQALIAQGHWSGEVISERADGQTYPEYLSVSVIRDGGGQVQYYVAVITNIATLKAHRQRLEHLATHDALTGMANRGEFERYCTQAITEAEQHHALAAVLFVDLDNFKIVNDSFSHAIGDKLLMRVADRIRAQLPEGAVAGRIGGDEFTVLLPRIDGLEQASALAERLIDTLSQPFVLEDMDIVLGASIGIAGYPLDGNDTVTLIGNADAAMYAAKVEERNAYRFYSPRMHADARRRLVLSADLRQALAHEEFAVVYQPIVDMQSGTPVAVEALLRWEHPVRGQISPAEFIPMAERLGMIRHIDEWVMQTVCDQMDVWDAMGLSGLRVELNVSAAWFGHPGFLETLGRTLANRHLGDGRLVLEITESAMLALGDQVERTMRALHRLGVGVAIDDFGTGYSSLTYLKLPAVDCLKIDRSFVDGLPESANDVVIIETVLDICQRMGLRAVAEGVETQPQHDFLRRAGCQEGQGYLYSRPVPPDQLESLLRDHAARQRQAGWA
ncbi:EAL domain-containing protein [Oleiagrimonas sp. C23AA]|nr:EAL domain-containing protein [Oleiagrimonas sp. C23AA]